jgi:hypothetical protein
MCLRVEAVEFISDQRNINHTGPVVCLESLTFEDRRLGGRAENRAIFQTGSYLVIPVQQEHRPGAVSRLAFYRGAGWNRARSGVTAGGSL